MQAQSIGGGGPRLVAPNLAKEGCCNCKFQRSLGGAFGDTLLCLESPPRVFPLPDVVIVGKQPDGTIVQRITNIRNEVRYPPAPDEWWCGQWKPRFLDNNGGRLS